MEKSQKNEERGKDMISTLFKMFDSKLSNENEEKDFKFSNEEKTQSDANHLNDSPNSSRIKSVRSISLSSINCQPIGNKIFIIDSEEKSNLSRTTTLINGISTVIKYKRTTNNDENPSFLQSKTLSGFLELKEKLVQTDNLINNLSVSKNISDYTDDYLQHFQIKSELKIDHRENNNIYLNKETINQMINNFDENNENFRDLFEKFNFLSEETKRIKADNNYLKTIFHQTNNEFNIQKCQLVSLEKQLYDQKNEITELRNHFDSLKQSNNKEKSIVMSVKFQEN